MGISWHTTYEVDKYVQKQAYSMDTWKRKVKMKDKQDMWAVTVNGNWRMTFYFEGQDAFLVDYMDYH